MCEPVNPPAPKQSIRFYAAIFPSVEFASFAFCYWLENRWSTSRLCISTSNANSVRACARPRPENRRKPRCSFKSANLID